MNSRSESTLIFFNIIVVTLILFTIAPSFCPDKNMFYPGQNFFVPDKVCFVPDKRCCPKLKKYIFAREMD